MHTLLQDLRYAFRMLMKAPVFTGVAVVTLAIGIGLNTAMFSVVHTVLMKPLPFGQPDRLIAVFDSSPKLGVLQGAVSPANFLDWRAQNKSLEGLSAYNTGTVTLTGSGNPKQIDLVQATPPFFGTMHAQPLLGRGFVEEEGEQGRDHVVVLSHRLWQQSFGSDPSMVGRSIQLDGEGYQVIGVMPASFQFPISGTDVWVPLSFDARSKAARGAHYLATIGRLKDGVALEQAQSDLKQIGDRLSAMYPKTNAKDTATLMSYRDALVGDVRPSLLVLLGGVGFVVLIACVNVANLLLARSAARERELAIRTALGAAKSRIIRQLLTESALLSVIGAGIGVAMAVWLQAAIARFGPKDVPLLDVVGIDSSVLMFTAGLAVVTTFLFGLLPAMKAAASDLNVAMKAGGMGSVGGKHHRTVRNTLVVAELALSIMLLVGAGLLIRSFTRLSGIDPGFQPKGIMTFSLSLPTVRYKESGQMNQFYDQVMERFRAVPGVQSAGAVNMLPLGDMRFSSSMAIDNSEDDGQSAQLRVASDGYFETMQIPLMQGRLFNAQDRLDTQRVLLISASAAKRFFPKGDAIGHSVKFGARPGNEKLQGVIVGIVGDVHALGLAVAPPPMFYAPYTQSGTSFAFFVIRAQGTPEGLLESLMGQVRGVDPNIPLADIMPMESLVSNSVSERRFYMFLLGLFAAVALLLSAVGIYGVISYSVTQRTREIGVRVALGARQADIINMVLREAMVMVFIGVAFGLITAALLTRFLSALLFGVGTHDPVTMLTVSVTLVAFALFASYWPARRATQVDPLVALRAE